MTLSYHRNRFFPLKRPEEGCEEDAGDRYKYLEHLFMHFQSPALAPLQLLAPAPSFQVYSKQSFEEEEGEK